MQYPNTQKNHNISASKASDCYFSAHLNAGLPNAFGEFDETPEIMEKDFHEFAHRGFLNLAGGCRATTPSRQVEKPPLREALELFVNARLDEKENR